MSVDDSGLEELEIDDPDDMTEVHLETEKKRVFYPDWIARIADMWFDEDTDKLTVEGLKALVQECYSKRRGADNKKPNRRTALERFLLDRMTQDQTAKAMVEATRLPQTATNRAIFNELLKRVKEPQLRPVRELEDYL